MTKVPDLSKFSVAEKDALILALFEQLATAHQRIEEQDKTIAEQAERIAALEAKLERVNRPSKTPDNSSTPPSKGQKKDRADPDHDRPRRKGRPGAGRSLHANPDRVVRYGRKPVGVCGPLSETSPDTWDRHSASHHDPLWRERR